MVGRPVNELVQWFVNLLKGARCWAVVLPWEQAVRVRMGKNALVWGPGFHWRIPFFDDVRLVNTRLRVGSTGLQALTTKDGKTVSACVSVGFRITDPLKALKALREPEGTCAVYAMTLVASYVIARNANEIDVEALGASVLASIQPFGAGGLQYDFVSIVDFAIVRTYRLIQEAWRPNTAADVEPLR